MCARRLTDFLVVAKWRILAEDHWYIVGEYWWYTVGEYFWYIVGECHWYIIGRLVTPARGDRFRDQAGRLHGANAQGAASLGCLRFNVGRHRRKVFQQHTVDEDVAAADTTEEDAVGAVVEEVDEAEGDVARKEKHQV